MGILQRAGSIGRARETHTTAASESESGEHGERWPAFSRHCTVHAPG